VSDQNIGGADGGGVQSPQVKRSEAIGYALLSFAFLAVSIGIGWWTFTQAPLLGPRFEYAYYLVVVVLGISVAVVLFGAMRSFARLSGTSGAVKGEVGGPAALAVLVVFGAFWLARPAESFPLTVRLSGDGLDASVLQETHFRIDLGERRDTRGFTADGQAIVPNIPTSLVNNEVPVSIGKGPELLPGRVRLKNPTAKLLIPSSRVAYIEVVVLPPEDPRRAEARRRIEQIRESIRITLMLNDEKLMPAFRRFQSDRTEQNWRGVQWAATEILQEIQKGTRATLEYDASFSPQISEVNSIATGQGTAVTQREFRQFGEPRREWNGRQFILKNVEISGPPSSAQADEWMKDLLAIYQRLEQYLKTVETQLAAK
jgi:hypothetical protein